MSLAETFEGPMRTRDMDAYLGRTQTTWGELTPNLAGMLEAAVAHDLSMERDLRPGEPLPELWHWAAFPEYVPQSQLGPDGHPALGGFLPDLGYSRRMWAGGRLAFQGDLRIGERLRRTSDIRSIVKKEGATGRMVFVKLHHHIENETGASIEEDQDVVYLDIPDSFRPPRKLSLPEAVDFDEPVPMSEARLFRFSAATFNAHRIHYDLPYAREVEKYPGLVVHGPMQAILVIEAGRRHTGQRPSRFRFRGIHPLFHDSDLRLFGRRDEASRAIALGTAASAGHIGLEARMEWD